MADFLLTLLPFTLAYIMFSLGLGLTLDDFKRVLVYPKAILTGALCQLVVLPLTAYLLILLFDMRGGLALGVMILSFCPGGVVSNMVTRLAHGAVALSVSLTGVISLLSVFTIPFYVSVFADYFLGEDVLEVSVVQIGLTMFAVTAVPVLTGVVVRHYKTEWAVRMDPFISRSAMLIFLAIVVASIASNIDLLVDNFTTLGLTLALMNAVLFVLGLAIAAIVGLALRERITISIEAGFQNSALGITIGTLIATGAEAVPLYSLPSAVYSVMTYIVAVPLIWWAREALKPHSSIPASADAGAAVFQDDKPEGVDLADLKTVNAKRENPGIPPEHSET